MAPANTALGSPLSKLLWGSLSCGYWPIQQLPDEFRTLRHSNVETLLLSGSIDVSTPAEFATEELLPYLKNGWQVIFSEFAHVSDIWKVRPKTTERILTSFYKTGVPDTSTNVYVPMDFDVSWSLLRIAKAALGAGVLVVSAVIAGVVWLVSKL
jgi:hypothetical protein